MRISDWSSDVCSSDLRVFAWSEYRRTAYPGSPGAGRHRRRRLGAGAAVPLPGHARAGGAVAGGGAAVRVAPARRSEEHTSETPVTNAHLVCRLLLEKKQKTQ